MKSRPAETSFGSHSLVGDGQLVHHIQVLHHVAELIEGDLAVEVLVGLDDGAVDELLQLDLVEVVAHHHLEHLEQLTVADETVVVDIIDLERESEFLLWAGTGRQRVKTLDKLKEGDVSIIVAIEHGNDALHQRVVRQLGNLEELGGLESAALISVDLAEVFVQLLQLLLVEVEVLELLLLLLQFVAHFCLL